MSDLLSPVEISREPSAQMHAAEEKTQFSCAFTRREDLLLLVWLPCEVDQFANNLLALD